VIKVEEKKRRIEASFFDDLLRDAGKSLFRGMAERLEAGAKDVLGWSLHRFSVVVIALGITITAAILILVAGVEGLKAASAPPWVAYLIAGGVGLGIGLVLFKLKK